MRISTNTIFEAGTNSIINQQSAMLKTQQQLSTGRRVLTPADDPIASARALQVEQADGTNTQYGVNRSSAKTLLSLVEASLGHAGDVLQNVREHIIQAGDGAYGPAQRRIIADDLRSLRAELLGIANSNDGEGHYQFAGYRSDVMPFADSPGGMQYLGDEGQRLIQVSASRQMPVSEAGADVFMRIRQGNGSFVISAAASNAGTATYDLGGVIDRSLLTYDDYRIDFTVTGTSPATTTTFDVVNVTTGATLLSAQPYTDGGAIQFDGMQLILKGTPADGDQFNVTPSANQDIFATIDNLVTLLETTPDTDIGHTQLTNGLTDAIGNVDRALDQLLLQRAGTGARLREVDDLQNIGEDVGLLHQQTLSDLRDLDYASAISELMRQQSFLEAAQQSFLRISQLSLFNYL